LSVILPEKERNGKKLIAFVQPERRKSGRLKDKKVWGDLFSLEIHDLSSVLKNM